MRRYSIAAFAGLILFSGLSWGISDPCRLLQTEIPESLKVSDIAKYRDKLQSECALTTTYRNFKQLLSQKYGLHLESVTEYQAMRFVRRVNFEDSKNTQTPVELTYQILRSSYSLPNSQKSSVIWDNWIKGIAQLEKTRNDVLAGRKFDFEDLKRVHVGFFQLSKENGDDAHIPDEGVVKPESDNDNYWWDFSSHEEANKARQIVEQINQHYDSLKLLPNFTDSELSKVISIRRTLKRQPADRQNVVEYVDAIYSGDTRANKIHVNNILNFVDTMLAQARNNQHMVWQGHLMTPAEVAYLAQKFYVGVHPFSEGNGRTSRFIQELVLTAFDMPHGSSGDLMDNDVLSTFEDYYNTAIRSNLALMGTLAKCVEQYEQQKNHNIRDVDQSKLDYSCRILKSGGEG